MFRLSPTGNPNRPLAGGGKRRMAVAAGVILAGAIGVAIIAIRVVGPPSSNPYPGTTDIAFPSCPPTTLTLSGTLNTTTKKDNPGGTWDATGATFDELDYPMKSHDWDHGCVLGGTDDGPNSPRKTRDQWFNGLDGGGDSGGETINILIDNNGEPGWLYLKDTKARWQQDFMDPNAELVRSSAYFNHLYGQDIQDDCLEAEGADGTSNYHTMNVYINNTYCEGFSIFGERPCRGCTAQNGTTNANLVVQNSLFYLKPMKLGPTYCIDSPIDRRGRCRYTGTPGVYEGSYGIWKWSKLSAAHVALKNVIFRLDMPSYSTCSSQQWPAGTYKNVTVVWTGSGPYSSAGGCTNKLPAGVTLTTDVSVWDKAKAQWLAQ